MAAPKPETPKFNKAPSQPLNRIGNLQKKVHRFNRAEKAK